MNKLIRAVIIIGLCYFLIMADMAYLIPVLALYCLPAMIADMRCHHNKGAIFALNLLLGWTFVGWVVAFVWALTNPVSVRVVAAN